MMKVRLNPKLKKLVTKDFGDGKFGYGRMQYHDILFSIDFIVVNEITHVNYGQIFQVTMENYRQPMFIIKEDCVIVQKKEKYKVCSSCKGQKAIYSDKNFHLCAECKKDHI